MNYRLITALLLAIVAMSGAAAAVPAEILVSTSTVGITTTHKVTITAPDGVTSLKINGLLYNGAGPAYNVADKFTVKIDGTETTSIGPVPKGTYPNTTTFVVTYANDKVAPNGDYTIEYSATYIGGYLKITKYLTAEVDIIAIPEFPTVAFPVAAVIGLVFFFHHRKKKEE